MDTEDRVTGLQWTYRLCEPHGQSTAQRLCRSCFLADMSTAIPEAMLDKADPELAKHKELITRGGTRSCCHTCTQRS